MNAVDQVAAAHRLQRERGYGARRVAVELGITRELAAEFLAQPSPEAQDPRVAVVAAAITAAVPRSVQATTMVSVDYHYTQAGHSSRDSWTGRPERLAELIVEALDQAGAQ